jgi:spermidine synthase
LTRGAFSQIFMAMTASEPILPTDRDSPRPYLLVLLLLFVGSGCAALVYEVVWLQLLQLVIGSSAVSLAVLLGTFMGGMCLGSLLLPRLISVRWHPLWVYALLELSIGALGLLVLFGIPWVEEVYVRYARSGQADVMLRGAVAAVCLLPPTLLLGATLPAIARWVETTPAGVSWLGFFYGGNIAGAVFGCLLAGFYLLRVFDMATATFVACSINFAVAASALIVATRGAPYKVAARVKTPLIRTGGEGAWQVYLAIALSGVSALGAEVVWTRLLSLVLGGTVYTFSLILAVFLLGLGIGSSAGAFLARRARSPRMALGACQWLLTAGIAWTAFMISGSLPYWPIMPELSSSPWVTFQLDLVRCLWAILPPACLWGASFPLALAAVAARGQDPGRLVGSVYAANTVGAIAGALLFSLVLIPMIGTAWAERLLIALAAAAGILALLPLVLDGSAIRPTSGDGAVVTPTSGDGSAVSTAGAGEPRAAAISDGLEIRTKRLRVGGALALIAATGGAGLLAWTVAPVPWPVVAYGRQVATWFGVSSAKAANDLPGGRGNPSLSCTYLGEGANFSVAVTTGTDGVRNFHAAGKIQASTHKGDMRVQRMLGHIPALLHKKPESALVVACGAGITAGTFVIHPDITRIVICDIEPLVPTRVAPVFGPENYHVVDGIARENPHTVSGKEVQVIYDDGRHFLETTRKKFDIITSDPVDLWVKGCAALNTVEYYQMCRDHLKPGGSVCFWIPLYQSTLETTKSVYAAFFKVFPHGLVWSNRREGEGYDSVLFGQTEAPVIDVDALQQRLDRPDHQLVKQSLRELGFGEIKEAATGEVVVLEEGMDLLASYCGEATSLTEWLRGAQMNTDRNLRLQYLAGFSLGPDKSEWILSTILAQYRFPDRTFIGSQESIDTLKRALKEEGRGISEIPHQDRTD